MQDDLCHINPKYHEISELVLSPLEGLVILDEIQILPELFQSLRVLVDHTDNKARFLILGSASPSIIKTASETPAGRAEFIELSGFNLLKLEDTLVVWKFSTLFLA
jgi:predicted AAA+ superfamily ATPase